MPGFYDNKTGKYKAAKWLEKADWYEDDNGLLYIVPQFGVVAECEGPDNAVMDEINRICREHGQLGDNDVERLGLHRIPDVLKRFSEKDGCYHA